MMENIILLILFTYPGAFVEYTYYFLAKERDFYQEPAVYFRTARVFFFSAVVTLVNLWLFGILHHGPLNLSTAVMFIKRENNAIHFALVSCGVSMLLGFIWYKIMCMKEKKDNERNLENGKATRGPRKQVWKSMFADLNTPQTNYIAEIYHDGKLVRRGLVYHRTNDPRDDNALALIKCDLVEEVLNTENQALIGEPMISYVDMDNNNEIILRDGAEFVAWLLGEEGKTEQS